MKKILFLGVDPDTTEDQIRGELERFGPVHEVQIVHDGDARHPWVVAYMDISDEVAYLITSRFQHRWHNGHLVTARLLSEHFYTE